MKALQNLLKSNQEFLAFIAGIVLVVGGFTTYDTIFKKDNTLSKSEVHVHADFLAYINNERLDLTAEQYQSSVEQVLHKDFHLHDNKDNLIHRHAENLTLVDFLSSLGFAVTDTCLTTDTAEHFCTDEEKVLQLYVNEKTVPNILTYVPQEEDKILLYYGTSDNPELETYLAQVTDESCIYSGTCPERGTPPPESCGLTCEI